MGGGLIAWSTQTALECTMLQPCRLPTMAHILEQVPQEYCRSVSMKNSVMELNEADFALECMNIQDRKGPQ